MKKLFFFVAAMAATTMAFAAETTFSATNLTADADAKTVSGTEGDITVLIEKQDGATSPTINATSKDVRTYAKNTLTFTSTENIVSIEFAISNKGEYRLTTVEATTGECAVTNTPNYSAVWTGNAKSVTLTVGEKAVYGKDGAERAGQLCFDQVVVTTEDGETTALENVEALSVYAENGRIFGAENARIYTISGQDVTAQNGQLKGMYIVKAGNQATKVMVK